MKAIRCFAEVDSRGEDVGELLAASESSLAFWDNPVDDEVWNDA